MPTKEKKINGLELERDEDAFDFELSLDGRGFAVQKAIYISAR